MVLLFLLCVDVVLVVVVVVVVVGVVVVVVVVVVVGVVVVVVVGGGVEQVEEEGLEGPGEAWGNSGGSCVAAEELDLGPGCRRVPFRHPPRPSFEGGLGVGIEESVGPDRLIEECL